MIWRLGDVGIMNFDFKIMNAEEYDHAVKQTVKCALFSFQQAHTFRYDGVDVGLACCNDTVMEATWQAHFSGINPSLNNHRRYDDLCKAVHTEWGASWWMQWCIIWTCNVINTISSGKQITVDLPSRYHIEMSRWIWFTQNTRCCNGKTRSVPQHPVNTDLVLRFPVVGLPTVRNNGCHIWLSLHCMQNSSLRHPLFQLFSY